MLRFNRTRESNGYTARARASLFLAFAIVQSGALAQESNLEILQRLTVECVQPTVVDVASVSLRTDAAHGALDPAVISALRADNKRVAVANLSQARDSSELPVTDATLSYFVDRSSIRYARSGRRHVNRIIEMDLGYVLVSQGGEVMSDGTCSKSHEDRIGRNRIESVENDAIPMTKGQRPRRSWIRRYAEPIVVGAATGVAVYLFFSVRSDSNN